MSKDDGTYIILTPEELQEAKDEAASERTSKLGAASLWLTLILLTIKLCGVESLSLWIVTAPVWGSLLSAILGGATEGVQRRREERKVKTDD